MKEKIELKGLIIAAGKGERLSPVFPVKPLLPLGGQALIDWPVNALIQSGIREIIVVTGYEGQAVRNYLENQPYFKEVSIIFIQNDEWEKENGLSVYKAKEIAGERFILLMSDHIFDPEIISLIKRQPLEPDELILAVDYRIDNHPYVDLEDVTRVQVDDGHITGIGKGITPYQAFDTGIFYATPALFQALEESQTITGNFTLSGGVRRLAARKKARVMDIGKRFWIDVDTEEAWKKAEELLKTQQKKTGG
ncbi:MAG: NTP transferase domain-containing protein [Candidatus Saccharicenans sp.]